MSGTTAALPVLLRAESRWAVGDRTVARAREVTQGGGLDEGQPRRVAIDRSLVFTSTPHSLAVMNPGGSIPFPIWIVVVLALVAVGGVLAFTRGRRK